MLLLMLVDYQVAFGSLGTSSVSLTDITSVDSSMNYPCLLSAVYALSLS